MSAIFISHSSADNAIAGELNARLAAHGHRSVFLDFDPERGIPAGRHWERELYAQLRACQAVVVLCSAQSMASPWCFAEITHARARGTPVLPLKVGDCVVSPLLTDVQVTDLTVDREAGWQRLVNGLAALGLDAASRFDWDGSRPPYPGLLAFQKADAAVYFGRDVAIQSTIETLNRLRRLGGARLLLLLGASGSGKSSLMRAGVVPRLERDRDRWLVAEPFRPLARPFDSLAMALAGLPGAGDWKSVRDALQAAAAAPDDGAWHDTVNDLRRAAGRPEAGLLLVVDQFEELLTAPTPGAAVTGRAASSSLAAADSGLSAQAADRDPDARAVQADSPADDHRPAADMSFLRLLRAMTAAPDGPLFVVATLRSDFLGAFQTHPALQGAVYEPVHLAQIALTDVAQVIDGPARVAGVELDGALVRAMVDDTATDDALPLLAFTLRELWDRFGDRLRRGGAVSVADYRGEIGGLQGALARAAEAICSERQPSAPGGQPAENLDALRRALLRLVRIDADARFVRQSRPWRDLPAAAHPLLERFVQARLLVSRSESEDSGGERVLEVAHEALFRSWGRLAAWLAADREFLLWRERLRGDAGDWQRTGRDASLLLRGPPLAEAQRWLTERAGDLEADARDFVSAGVAARDAEQAARDRRRRRLTAALAGAALGFGGLAAAAGWQWQQASEQRRLALARQLNAQADVAQPRDPVLGLLLTVQSLQSAWTPDGHGALLERLDALARPQPASAWKPHPGPVRAMALSPDERWLATAGPRHLQVQSAAGEVRDLASRNGHDYIHALAFSPGGEWLAAACEERVACVYDTATWREALRLPPSLGPLSALSFAAGGRVLASSSRNSGAVRFHAMPGGDELPPITTASQGVDAMGFSPDGTRVAVSTRQKVEVWTFPRRTLAGETTGSGGMALSFSEDGQRLAVSGAQSALVFDLADDGDGDVKLTLRPTGGLLARAGRPFSRLAFSADGRYVAATDSEDGTRVADLQLGRIAGLAPQPAGALAFGTGRRLMTAGNDGRISEWQPDDKPLRRIAHAGAVHAVALSADGRWLATASEGDVVRLIDSASGREVRALPLAVDPGALGFSADGRWLGAVHDNELALVDPATGRVNGPFVHAGRVSGVSFEDGGQRVATATAWDAPSNGRYGIKRPTLIRVWDIDGRREAGWRFDIERDTQRAPTIAAKNSLAAVQPTAGGDAVLAAAAASWPAAYRADDLNHDPLTIVPSQHWLSAKTAKGDVLADTALQRARAADGVDADKGAFAFSADGRLLASAAGREARLWPLTTAELSAEACVRLPRNLSCAEWREAMADAPYAKTCPQRPDPPDKIACDKPTPAGQSATP